MNNKRWFISPSLTTKANQDLEKFPTILRQLLFNRGYANYDEARAFLRKETIFDTSPFQLTGMEQAVERIFFALDHLEPVTIYGDYDVDGVTATALLVQSLTAMGLDVRGYIPNRFDEGYGLNNDALTGLKQDGVKLVITVDCGIRSPDEAAHASQVGLDLIITDHHQPSDELPSALALINPKQPGDTYPDKDLAGVGIAYKLAQALWQRAQLDGRSPAFTPEALLDLVALGTVADLAPLVGENRALVNQGLQRIRANTRQGLFALANVAGMSIGKTTATNIGFTLGPRLNAAGRLESALAAFHLLNTTEISLAGELALKLDDQNRERQTLTRKIQAEAEKIALGGDPDAHILFAVDPEFNPGVVGLAAARLAKAAGRKFILNPAPAQDLRTADLRAVFALTPNEREGRVCLGLPPDAPVSDEEVAALRAIREQNVQVAAGHWPRDISVQTYEVEEFVKNGASLLAEAADGQWTALLLRRGA